MDLISISSYISSHILGHILLYPILQYIWNSLFTMGTLYIVILFMIYGVFFVWYESFTKYHLLAYFIYPLIVWILDIVSGYTLLYIWGKPDAVSKPGIVMTNDQFRIYYPVIVAVLLFTRAINRYYKLM